MVPTMGMCGPAALGPAAPVRREACWDAASTEVERELKSMRTVVRVAGAKVVGGPAWRVPGDGIPGPPCGGVQRVLTPLAGAVA